MGGSGTGAVSGRSRLRFQSPPSNRACGSPAHGLPTLITGCIQRFPRQGRKGLGGMTVLSRMIRPRWSGDSSTCLMPIPRRGAGCLPWTSISPAAKGVVPDLAEGAGRPPPLPGLIDEHLQGIVRRPLRAEPETARQEVRFEDRLEHDLHRGLHDAATHRGDRQRPAPGRCPAWGSAPSALAAGTTCLPATGWPARHAAGSPPYTSTSAKVVLSMPGAPLLRRSATHARHKTSSR